jgi:hypothetical protein
LLLTQSGLLAMLPFALAGPVAAFAPWNTASIVAVGVGIACSLRFAGARLTGRVAAATVLVVSISESLTATLLLGNPNNSLLLALVPGSSWPTCAGGGSSPASCSGCRWPSSRS